MTASLAFPEIGPDLIRIELGDFTLAIRYYALAYILGLILGWRLVLMALRRPALWPSNTPPMNAEQLEAMLTWIIVGVILGGRLVSVFVYNPGYYLANPGDIIKVWQGGMAFHGGFLGVVLATWIYSRKHGLPLGSVADCMALAAPIGLFLGRIANFINGELWGAPTSLPWGVIFPGAAAQDCPGVIGACARHPSQLYEAALEGLLLGLLLLFLAFRRGALKTPWRICGTFLFGYGVSRFLVEFVRQADAQFITPDNPAGHVALWMSMGQLLSVPMIAAGAWLIRGRR